MDRLDLALRRYQQLLPRPLDHGRMPLRDLNIWIQEDVNPVLEDYTRRPAFREHASWPVRGLQSGAQTSERGLIDSIDAELVKCARALHRLASNRLVERKIKENVPSALAVTGETVEIVAAGARKVAAVNGPLFEPQQEWTEDGDGRKIQHAGGVVFLNPELLPIGNFIVRRLLARINVRMDVLRSPRGKCLTALRQVRPNYQQQFTEFETSWSELTRLNLELDRIFRTGGPPRLRDACVTATQVYAAFHPDPDLDWLGLNANAFEKGIQSLRLRSTGWDNAHFFERIAGALGSLGRLYQDVNSERSAFEQAVAGGGLVIDTTRHEAFWEAQTLKEQPTDSAMQFLIALARKALHGSAVEIRDIWGDDAVSDSVISTTWGRLKKCLPASLRTLVKPGVQPRTYRLELDADRIQIFP